MAKEFGLSPYAVANEIDDDPEQLALVCIRLLRYSEAHAAYRHANADELKGWQGSPMMAQVQTNDFAQVERETEEDE